MDVILLGDRCPVFCCNPQEIIFVKQTFIARLSLIAILSVSTTVFSQTTSSTARIETKSPETTSGRTAKATTVQVIKSDLSEALSVIEANHVDGKALDYATATRSSRLTGRRCSVSHLARCGHSFAAREARSQNWLSNGRRPASARRSRSPEAPCRSRRSPRHT